MKLPNAEQAVVEIEKLRDYCLNPEHRRGGHKARVFKASLGITQEHAEDLRKALLAAAINHAATAEEHDEYGRRYVTLWQPGHWAGQWFEAVGSFAEMKTFRR